MIGEVADRATPKLYASSERLLWWWRALDSFAEGVVVERSVVLVARNKVKGAHYLTRDKLINFAI